jgi:nitronate monooxygenase
MLPEPIRSRLRLPLIAAPMLRVSGPNLVIAACRAGIVGAFPTVNARGAEDLDSWLTTIERAAARSEVPVAPHCPNLIVRQPTLAEHLDVLLRHRVEMVITSVGSPASVIGPLHEVGTTVLSDVATLKHARKAVAGGADGLVLLTAGAGGQTGWLNPFAFVRAVRAFYAGTIVLAGGIADGYALAAALVLGCDLAYMGTRFIATRESLASVEYKSMLVASNLDEIVTTSAFTGLPTNMLRPAIAAAGLDPNRLDEQVTVADAERMYGGKGSGPGPQRWRDVFSAGHSVSGVDLVRSVTELVARIEEEFRYSAERRNTW